MRRDDWLLHQLPVGMVEDDFLARFLMIFQTIADTEMHQIDAVRHMFDPNVAPDAMVRTMGTWLGIHWIDPSLPDDLQRRIVLEYASLVRWRGTRRGLRQLLELVSQAPATVLDTGGVYAEGEAPASAAHAVLRVESSGWATEPDLLRIVRAEMPANMTFELFVADRRIWPPEPDRGGGVTAEILQGVS